VGRAADGEFEGSRLGFRGSGFGDPPWSSDLEGGPGVTAEPTVVVDCGRNGERRQRRPLGWWRRPVGPRLAAGVGLVRNGGEELGGGGSGGAELVDCGSGGGGAVRAREGGVGSGGKWQKWLGRVGKGAAGGRWGERVAARSPRAAVEAGGGDGAGGKGDARRRRRWTRGREDGDFFFFRLACVVGPEGLSAEA
jgi:hypothetical protein